MPYLVIAHGSIPDALDLTRWHSFSTAFPIQAGSMFIDNCYVRMRSKYHLSFSCALTLGGNLVTEEALVAALGQKFSNISSKWFACSTLPSIELIISWLSFSTDSCDLDLSVPRQIPVRNMNKHSREIF